MAFFSRDKKDAAPETKKDSAAATTKEAVGANAAKSSKGTSTARATDRDLSSVIIKPRITEKAVGMSEQNAYTFIVRRDATKYDVADAIKALYSVTPVKVNIVNKSARQYMSRSRGRKIGEPGMKKAYVYLKPGDRIDLV